MRSFDEAWPDLEFVQEVLEQLPRGHNLVLLDKLKSSEDSILYAKIAIENNRSRNVLVIQIESKLIERIIIFLLNF